MRLFDLLGEKKSAFDDFEITHLTDDSRQVKAGGVFVCLERDDVKVRQYIQGALDKGAAACIIHRSLQLDMLNTPLIQSDNPEEILRCYAQKYYPNQPGVVVGVTGTNGKTSVAWFYNCLLRGAGKKVASIGTLGVYKGENLVEETGYTSPPPLVIHRVLDDLAKDGIGYVCVEVSSHALALERIDGVRFVAGGFTNLTPDHRDFHGSMDAYAAAKGRLFAEVLPKNAAAVIYMAKEAGWMMASLCKQRGLDLLTAGAGQAECVVRCLAESSKGQKIEVKYAENSLELTVPLVGAFQAENLAVAVGLALKSGLSWAELVAGFSAITAVPGRMEIIQSSVAESAPLVVVDYAHTSDALEKAILALKPRLKGRLFVVFGCGGNRDVGKRALMGAVVKKYADVAIVTDDNPRFEDAGEIRRQIMVECPEAQNIGDREAAIRYGIMSANADDIVLIAGKGHEQGQYVSGHFLPFDDRSIAQKVMQEKEK